MTTRRSLLAGLAPLASLAACHPAVPAPHPRFAEDHPDAELLDLDRRRSIADAAYDAATLREEELDGAGHPAMPAALLLRDSDHELWLNALAVQDGSGEMWFFLLGEAGAALRSPQTRLGNYPPDPDHPLFGKAHTITRRVPWPERQTRADEIVAAWDRWKTDEKVAQDRCGYTAAQAECERAGKAAGDIERAIEGTAPRTLDGLAVKARLLRDQTARYGVDLELAEILTRDVLALARGVA